MEHVPFAFPPAASGWRVPMCSSSPATATARSTLPARCKWSLRSSRAGFGSIPINGSGCIGDGADKFLAGVLRSHPLGTFDGARDRAQGEGDRSGILLLATAVGGRIWVWAHLGRNRRWHFVSDGPYSIVRHPLYAFSILGAAGVGAQSGSLLVTVLFTFAVWAVFNRIARIEETDMASRFGDAYRAYLARTPRFVPNPALWPA